MPTNEEVIEKEVNKMMDNFVDRVFQLSQEKLVEDNKIDTSTMMRTANINRAFLNKEIVYPANWSDTIEFGRQPGTMPPPDALVGWIRRKLRVTNEAEARRIAFAIARAIKERGTDSFFFLTSSFEQAMAEFGIEYA